MNYFERYFLLKSSKIDPIFPVLFVVRLPKQIAKTPTKTGFLHDGWGLDFIHVY
jgi:hypothetical protein